MIVVGIVAGTEAAAATCDYDALKTYPMREALKSVARPLGTPELYFRLPGEDTPPWERVDEKIRKAALARALEKLRPEERPILVLAAISHWTSGKDPMVNFFVLPPGSYYDEAIKALDEMGLTEHAKIFRQGHALFAPDYGTDQQRYDRWSDGHGTILDPALDGQLMALSERYGKLPDPLDIAAWKIGDSETLTAMYEPIRAATTEDVRLSYLGYGLWNCVDHYGTPEAVSRRLAEMPEAYRHIAVSFIFQAEMLNGSVEQFFYNSAGVLAPDVVIALRAMGLEKHAATLQRGIDLFPKPYPRDSEVRRAILEADGTGLRDKLSALTADVDDGAIQPTMIRTAKEAGVLPK